MRRCAYVQPRLRAHMDGELTPGERLAVDDHLAECGRCREQRETLLRAVVSVRSLPVEEPPDHFGVNLHVRLASLRARKPRGWRAWVSRLRPALPARVPGRLGWAGAAAVVAGLFLATVLMSQKPGFPEISRWAGDSWVRVHDYSCLMVTTGIYQGRSREFKQKTWFARPGLYRFETEQDYPLVTVVDGTSIRHFIRGGDWQGRGPLLIVRPRTSSGDALPFPFGLTWPASPNLTVDALIRQISTTRDAQVIGTDTVLDHRCYRVRFDDVPPGGRQAERCTVWIAEDTRLPLRVERYRDEENHTVTTAADLDVNDRLQPSDLFDLRPPQGALVIHGDVDPHVFALKPSRAADFDSDPVGSARREIAWRAESVPFAAFAPQVVPEGYRLVRVRRSPGRWLDAYWMDDRRSPARVMRLQEQSGEVEDPPEVRGGDEVNLGSESLPVAGRVRQGRLPYPYCYVAWRQKDTLLTLSTAELGLEETLRVARSMRWVNPDDPRGTQEFVGPPLPERSSSAEERVATGEPAGAPRADAPPTTSSCEPSMVPETAEDEPHAPRAGGH